MVPGHSVAVVQVGEQERTAPGTKDDPLSRRSVKPANVRPGTSLKCTARHQPQVLALAASRARDSSSALRSALNCLTSIGLICSIGQRSRFTMIESKVVTMLVVPWLSTRMLFANGSSGQ